MAKRITILYLLTGLQLFSIALILGLSALFRLTHFTDGIGKELQDAFVEVLGLEHIHEFGAREAGRLFGFTIIPLALLLGALIGINSRRRGLTLVFYLLLLMFDLSQGGFPVSSIICLIMLMLPRGRKVWSRRNR